MTQTLIAPRNIAFFALLATLLFAFMASASTTRAQEPDTPQVIIDCFDPEKGTFVPCEDIEDGPVLSPSECPEVTIGNPIPGTPYFSCDDPGVPFTCDRIAVAMEKGLPLTPAHYEWYKLNCVDEPECYDGPPVFTHVPSLPPCDDRPELSCERLEWAISKGHKLPTVYQDWYNKNCGDDYSCRELANAIAMGALLSQDAWNWYHENCEREELTCEDIARILAKGGLITIELYNWYQENCEREELTCLEVSNLMQAGKATVEQQQWYERNCPDTTTEQNCEDGPAAFNSLAEYLRLCGDPNCEDKFSFPSLEAYLEECTEDACRVDCEPGNEPGCEVDCEPQTQEICEVDCEPLVEETPEPDPIPTPEITFQPEAPKPPKAGAGQLFTTGTQGFGLASIALVVLGGALAGTLLRRKA